MNLTTTDYTDYSYFVAILKGFHRFTLCGFIIAAIAVEICAICVICGLENLGLGTTAATIHCVSIRCVDQV